MVGKASLGGAALTSALSASAALAAEKQPQLSWGVLLHLGRNMWGDCDTAYSPPAKTLIAEEQLWEELTIKAAESGLNMVVVDLGEAIQYQSCPEIAIDGAWTVEKLRKDIERMRGLGLEVIPKLNFSSCHDFWLGEYARMLSTKPYYNVCSKLIKEVSEIFDYPRYFHLGYDEENYPNQVSYEYVVIRQKELWKHDFLFFVEECEKNNVRPWIWADYGWNHEDFVEWAPKSVVMSNWYYGTDFDTEKVPRAKFYKTLQEAGYDQIPTGSNWSNDENFELTVKFGKENLSGDRLLGYLQTPWHMTISARREHNLHSIELVAEAKKKYYGD